VVVSIVVVDVGGGGVDVVRLVQPQFTVYDDCYTQFALARQRHYCHLFIMSTLLV